MKQSTLTEFISQYAESTGWTFEQIKGRSRIATHNRIGFSLVDVRHVLWYTLRNYSRLSYPDMAIVFNRDHSTIVVGVQRIENQRALYDDLNQLCILAQRILQNIQYPSYIAVA